jgi:hypothetical protein
MEILKLIIISTLEKDQNSSNILHATSLTTFYITKKMYFALVVYYVIIITIEINQS